MCVISTSKSSINAIFLQVLWEHVQPSQNFSIYNGGVEAVSNLLSKKHQINVSSADTGLEKNASRKVTIALTKSILLRDHFCAGL